MLNFFDGKKKYGGRWSVKSTRKFTEDEISEVNKAFAVSSEYGTSCCFLMKSGEMIYQPFSNDSTVTVGEEIDLNKVEIVTLRKDGENDIERIKI